MGDPIASYKLDPFWSLKINCTVEVRTFSKSNACEPKKKCMSESTDRTSSTDPHRLESFDFNHTRIWAPFHIKELIENLYLRHMG